MRKILKALSLVMVLVMCFTMVFTTAVSAEGTDTLVLSVDNAAPKAGDTVNITVTSNFTTVAGAHFAIDLAGLEYVSVAGDYADYFSDETMNFVKEFNEDNGNLVESGVLFVITATVPADAEAGTVYNVGFGTIATNKEFCDYNENEVVVTKTGVDVTVAADEPSCDHADADKELVNVTETEFVYDCVCACGETFTETIPISDTVYDKNTGISRSIMPTNDISMYFYFRSSRVTQFSNLTVVINKEVTDTDFATPVAYLEDQGLTDIGGDELYHKFVYSDLAAYEMSAKIGIKLYGYIDGEMMLLKESDYSVVDYVLNQTSEVNNAFNKAMFDLLNYGAYTQLYTGYNTENLANSKLSAAQKAIATQYEDYPDANTEFTTVSGTQRPDETTEAGRVSISKSLYPGSKVFLEFLLTKYSGDLNNYSCYYEYYDVNGNYQVSDTVNYADTNKVFQSYPAFEFDLAPVSTLDYPVVIHVFYNGTEVINTPYSIETYINNMLTGSTNMGENFNNMLKAMYSFGHSLAAYGNIPAYTPAA